MSGRTTQTPINRRGFMKIVVATAVGATAVGAGGAVLKDKMSAADAVITTSSNPVPSTFAPAAATPLPAVDRLSELAGIQAENLRLQSELDAALRRLDSAESSTSNQQNTNSALTTQLQESNLQVSVLAGLITLYEQLEATPLVGAVTNGLDVVGGKVTDFFDDIPTINEGLILGRDALTKFESDIPLLEAGRKWLITQTDKLSRFHAILESAIVLALEKAEPFFKMLNDWFQKVMGWVPFGLGDKAAAIWGAMTDILVETPATVSGLNSQITSPITTWVGEDYEEAPLLSGLIRPIREQVIVATEQALNKAAHMKTAYNNQLHLPTQAALTSHNLLCEQIAAYREANNLTA